VLTEAAVYGKVDKLVGLKENVIIGKLIPAHNPVHEQSPKELPEAEPAMVGAAYSLPSISLDEDENMEEESIFGD
jgi:hypothetical protein